MQSNSIILRLTARTCYFKVDHRKNRLTIGITQNGNKIHQDLITTTTIYTGVPPSRHRHRNNPKKCPSSPTSSPNAQIRHTQVRTIQRTKPGQTPHSAPRSARRTHDVCPPDLSRRLHSREPGRGNSRSGQIISGE